MQSCTQENRSSVLLLCLLCLLAAATLSGCKAFAGGSSVNPAAAQVRQEPTQSAASAKPGMTIEAAVNVLMASIDKKYEFMSVADLEKQLAAKQPMTVVDCRLPDAYAKSHIEGAVNVPYDRFDDEFRKIPKDRPVVAVCYVGMFSRVAAQKFAEDGYGPVYSVTGGMKEWNATHGLETEK